MFNPTVDSSATSANRRHSRLPLQADLAAARGIVTTWRTTPSKPPSRSSRPGFASAFRGKADGQLPSIPIAAEGSRRVGPLRGFLPRGLSNACPHASSCPHAAADKGRRRTNLNDFCPMARTKRRPAKPLDTHAPPHEPSTSRPKKETRACNRAITEIRSHAFRFACRTRDTASANSTAA
jgi:hypothetical protein